MGTRRTKRIRDKIIYHLKLDSDVFFNRTYGELQDMNNGTILPLPTKAEVKKRRIEFDKKTKAFENAFKKIDL